MNLCCQAPKESCRRRLHDCRPSLITDSWIISRWWSHRQRHLGVSKAQIKRQSRAANCDDSPDFTIEGLEQSIQFPFTIHIRSRTHVSPTLNNCIEIHQPVSPCIHRASSQFVSIEASAQFDNSWPSSLITECSNIIIRPSISPAPIATGQGILSTFTYTHNV